MDENKNFSQCEKDGVSLLLLMLICADLAFVGVHLLAGAVSLDALSSLSGVASLDDYKSSLLLINKDRGYAEVYQYMKEFWIILLLLFVYSKTKERGYFAWSAVFVYLLFDDAMRIHERIGLMLADRLELNPAIGLRPEDFGELTVTAVSAALLLTAVGFFYVRGSTGFKRSSRDFLLLLSGIAFFGVFIDMVDIVIRFGSTVTFFMETIEDGGEMIVMSMIVGYTFLLSARDGRPSFSLSDIVVDMSKDHVVSGASTAYPLRGVGALVAQKREAV